MRELSPFYIPFIPAKYYASLLPSYAYFQKVCCASIVVWDQTTIGLRCEPLLLHPRMTTGLHRLPISLHNRPQSSLRFIPSPSTPLSHSSPSFFPHESAPLPQESEIFFTPCKLLVYAEMNATQRAVLRNILR